MATPPLNFGPGQSTDEMLSTYNESAGFDDLLNDYKNMSAAATKTGNEAVAGMSQGITADDVLADYQKLSRGMGTDDWKGMLGTYQPQQEIATPQQVLQEGASKFIPTVQEAPQGTPAEQLPYYVAAPQKSDQTIKLERKKALPSRTGDSIADLFLTEPLKDRGPAEKGGPVGAGVRPLMQNGQPLSQFTPSACGQYSTAVCINAVTGKSLTDVDINAKYGYSLLGALNAESREKGVSWKDGGDIGPGKWSLIEKKVAGENLPVMVALNGPEFSSSGRGHIVTITKVQGDKVYFMDPATGRTRATTKERMNNAASHPDGNFIFYPEAPAGHGAKRNYKNKSPLKNAVQRDPQVVQADREVYKNKTERLATMEGINRPDIIQSAMQTMSGYNPKMQILQTGGRGLGGMTPVEFERIKKQRGDAMTWEAYSASPGTQAEYTTYAIKEQLERHGSYPRALAAYHMANSKAPRGLIDTINDKKDGMSLPADTLHYVTQALGLDDVDEARALILDKNKDQALLYRPGTNKADQTPFSAAVDSALSQMAGALVGFGTGILPEELAGFNFGKADQTTDYGFAKAQWDKKGAGLAGNFLTGGLSSYLDVKEGGFQDPYGSKVNPNRKPENLESHKLASDYFFGTKSSDVHSKWYNTLAAPVKGIAQMLESEFVESLGLALPGPGITGKVVGAGARATGAAAAKMAPAGTAAVASKWTSFLSKVDAGVNKGIASVEGKVMAKAAAADAKKAARKAADDAVLAAGGQIQNKAGRVAAGAAQVVVSNTAGKLAGAIWNGVTRPFTNIAKNAVGGKAKREMAEFSITEFSKLNFKMEQQFALRSANAAFHKQMAGGLQENMPPGAAFIAAMQAGLREGVMGLGIGVILRTAGLGVNLAEAGLRGAGAVVGARIEDSAIAAAKSTSMRGALMDGFLSKAGSILPAGEVKSYRAAALSAYQRMGAAARNNLDDLAMTVRASTLDEVRHANAVDRAKRGHAHQAREEAHFQTQTETYAQGKQKLLAQEAPLRQKVVDTKEAMETAYSVDPALPVVRDSEVAYKQKQGTVLKADEGVLQAEGLLKQAKMSKDPAAVAKAQEMLGKAKQAQADANISYNAAQKQREKLMQNPDHAARVQAVTEWDQKISQAEKAHAEWQAQAEPQIAALDRVAQVADHNLKRAQATKLYWEATQERINNTRMSGGAYVPEDEVSAALGITDKILEITDLVGDTSNAPNYHYAKGALEASNRARFVDNAVGDHPEIYSARNEANIFVQEEITPDQLRSAAGVLESQGVGEDLVTRLRKASAMIDEADVTNPTATQKAQLDAKTLRNEIVEEVTMAMMKGEGRAIGKRPEAVTGDVADLDSAALAGTTERFASQAAVDFASYRAVDSNLPLSRAWMAGPLGNPASVDLPPLSRMMQANNPDRHMFTSLWKEQMATKFRQQNQNPTAIRLEETGLNAPIGATDDAIDQSFRDLNEIISTTQTDKEGLMGSVMGLFRVAGDHPSKWGSYRAMLGGLYSQQKAGKNLAAGIARQVEFDLAEGFKTFTKRAKSTLKEGAAPMEYKAFENKILDMIYEADPARMASFLTEMPEARTSIRSLMKTMDLMEKMKVLSPDLKSGNMIDTYFPIMQKRFSMLKEANGGEFLDPEIKKAFGNLNSESERLFPKPSDARAAYNKALTMIGVRPRNSQSNIQAISDYIAGRGKRDEGKWLTFLQMDAKAQAEYVQKVNPDLLGKNADEMAQLLKETKIGLLVGEPVADLSTLVKAHVGQVYKADAQRFFMRTARAMSTDIGGRMVPLVGTKGEIAGVLETTIKFGKNNAGRYTAIDDKVAAALNLESGQGQGLFMHPEFADFMDKHVRDWTIFAEAEDGGGLQNEFKKLWTNLRGMPLTGPAGPFRAQIYGNFAEFFNGNIAQLGSARKLGNSTRLDSTVLRFYAENSGLNMNSWRQLAYGISDEMTANHMKAWEKTGGIDPERAAALRREHPELAKDYDEFMATLEDPSSPMSVARDEMAAKGEAEIARQQDYETVGSKAGGLLERGLQKVNKGLDAHNRFDAYIQNRALFDDLNDVAVGAWMMKVDQLKMTEVPRLMADGMDYDSAMRAVREKAAVIVNAKAGTVGAHLKTSNVNKALEFATQTPSYLYTRVKDFSNALSYGPRKFAQAVERESGVKFPDYMTRSPFENIQPQLRGQLEKEMAYNVYNSTLNMFAALNTMQYLVNGSSTADLGKGNELQFEFNGTRVALGSFNYVKMMTEWAGLPTMFRTSGAAETIVEPEAAARPPGSKEKLAKYAFAPFTEPSGTGSLVKRQAVEAGQRALQSIMNQGSWLGGVLDVAATGVNNPMDALKEVSGAVREYGALAGSGGYAAADALGMSPEEGSMADDVLGSLARNPNTNTTYGFVESILNSAGVLQRVDEKGTAVEMFEKLKRDDKQRYRRNLNAEIIEDLSVLGRRKDKIMAKYQGDTANPAFVDEWRKHQEDLYKVYQKATDPTVSLPRANISPAVLASQDVGAPTRDTYDDAMWERDVAYYYSGGEAGRQQSTKKIEKASKERVEREVYERERVRNR